MDDLSKMSKDELIDYAAEKHSLVLDGGYTKKELRNIIEKHMPPASPEPEEPIAKDSLTLSGPTRIPTPAERRAMKAKRAVHYPRRVGKGIQQIGPKSITTGG